MEFFKRPLRLKTNKIPYLITGGELINRFLGEEEKNAEASQMWVASVVQCVLDGAADSRSYLVSEDGGACLAELIKGEPEQFLGKEFADRAGGNPGFLLKLLNSRDRLLVQVHPDKEKAARYFNSPYGKTECWYVLDVEPERDAYIWAGFRPGVTKDLFLDLVRKQDTERLLNCLHRFVIHPGDVIFIQAGLPHAMGSGSLIAEIQEPTDITLRAERFRPDGSELPEESLHSGIGYDGLLDCFSFDCAEEAQIRKRIFLQPDSCVVPGGTVYGLVGPSATDCFGMSQICCDGVCKRENRRFAVLLVLEGAGVISWGEGEDNRVKIQKGTELFLPHGVTEYAYEPEGTMRILECYPPLI